MLLYLDPERVEADLAARRLACPSCASGRLAPWARARPRVLSLLEGRRVRLTPGGPAASTAGAPTCCCPVGVPPDVGTGSRSSPPRWPSGCAGGSHRGIGERLGVSAGTVRGWLRRLGQRAEQLRAVATGHLYGLDPAAASLEPTGSRLGDALAALAALAAAVHAAQHRLGRARPGLVWALLGRFGLIQSLASARAG